jgi:phosphate transport system protein
MARESFQEALEALRDAVLSMGEAVASRLRDAVTAIDRRDRSLARYVLEHDHEINDLYLELEADCVDLFALEQPVAGDLRFVAASFKILTDLERIADLAANLGGYVLSMAAELVPREDLVDIGTLVEEMLDDALTAYATEDAGLCEAIAERDDEIDGLCGRAADLLMRDLLDRDPNTPELEELLGDANRLLLTIRDLERVGDHAVNVAARTYYMIESDDALLY